MSPLKSHPLGARDGNLDWLRFVAILLVVLHHSAHHEIVRSEWLTRHEMIAGLLDAGKYGVDLFFVLSGWLIGGLYFKEHHEFGGVQTLRFLGRRWLRTLPPYFCLLGITFWAKKTMLEPQVEFDLRYLFFLQNYDHPMPFWSATWSLCVEEHFYFFLPLVLVWTGRLKGRIQFVFLGAIIGSALGRAIFAPAGSGGFNYYSTASHLRLEGLILGVWAAYIHRFTPTIWHEIRKYSPMLVCVGLGLVGSLNWCPVDFVNRAAYTLVDLTFAAILVSVVGGRDLPFAGSSFIRFVALGSYSIYLTHVMTFHIFRAALSKFGLQPPAPVSFILAFLLVFAVGSACYFALELTSIRLRDRWLPRRLAGPSV